MKANHHSMLGIFTANRHLLILTIAIILVAGLSALNSLPRIEDPRITTRNASIFTQFPGASAERVEALVSKKIEDKLRELSDIKTIESSSSSGISIVNVELQDWVGEEDNEQIFSQIRDRLEAASAELPAGASTPEFDDMRGAVAFSLVVALSWQDDENNGLGILNRRAEQLGDRLRNLPGTEQVVYFGTADEEIQVNVDAAEAASLGINVNQLASAIAAADARRSAGTLTGSERNVPLELNGALDSAERIASIPLIDDGLSGLVHVGDIASVRTAWQDPPAQVALHNGARSILVAVRTEEAVRLDLWSETARLAVADYAAELDSDLRLETVFDQSIYTDERLSNLAGNLLAGAAVVVLVVWLMMGWRPALIVGSALPLSAALSLFGLTFFGEQIHQMTIFGMIIAIGLLIDNAIVMTDQVVSRRRAGASPIEAVVAAIQHLFAPLFASTITTILGFMPIFLLPGNVGDFVGPIAIAVVLALIASFFLAMTVIPALAGLLAQLEQTRGRRWWRDGARSKILGNGYQNLLLLSLRHPLKALILTLVLPITGFVLAGTLGMQFFPPADRDQLEIQLWMPGGTSIDKTTRQLESIERVIREIPGTGSMTWVAGASSPPLYYNQLRQQENNSSYARGVLKVEDAASAKRLERTLQNVLTEQFSDAQLVVRAFGQGPPITAPIGFRIIGPDSDTLRDLGEQLRTIIHQQPAVTHTQASIQGGEPKLWLDINEQRARLAGLSLSEIASQFQGSLDGRIGGRVLDNLEDLPVRIRYDISDRDSVADISTLRLSAGGQAEWIPVNALGSLRLAPELQGITRRNGERVNTISGYLQQGALPIEVTGAVTQAIAEGDFELPAGYRIELAGDSAEQSRAVAQLLTYAPVLATLMIATLVLSFRSFALAGLIGLVAMMSVGLGMLSLWAGGFPLGFNPLIGTAGLVGVAINGSIVVLAAIRANPLARQGDISAIADETFNATRHILSTTLTTVAGFMPLLLMTGGDFWPPLAIVIAGGVGLSGLLSLILTPVAYRLMSRLWKEKTSDMQPAAMTTALANH